MEDLKEELTTIYHDNYSEEEFVKEMGTFILQREKDLLDDIKKLRVAVESAEIDIEMAITTNPDYMEFARLKVQDIRKKLGELSNE